MMSTTDGPEIPRPSEATDGSELGEEIGDDTLPGTVGYPPTEPVGVGPAGSELDPEHHDSMEERMAREEPEVRPPDHDVVVLVEPFPDGMPDDEPESIGEAVPPVGLASPEEAAMHIEDETGGPPSE